MKNKKAIEMSFNWIFSIIVGAVIIFIAIYATVKIVGVSEYQIYTESASKIESLLDPIRPGLAEGKYINLNFKKDTRLYFTCTDVGNFGKQTISFSEKTFSDWTEKGGLINTQKYVFSREILEGKSIYLFSMPFDMPFKIDDLIMIGNENYCFIQAPNKVIEDIKGLGMDKVYFAESSGDENCTGKKVCFNSQCDIRVYGMCENSNCDPYEYGKVIKEGKSLYYNSNLLYAAIFSSPAMYDCNVKRLMKRFYSLGEIYNGKIGITKAQGCDLDIELKLSNMMNSAKNLNSSQDLYLLSQDAEELNTQNSASACKLW